MAQFRLVPHSASGRQLHEYLLLSVPSIRSSPDKADRLLRSLVRHRYCLRVGTSTSAATSHYSPSLLSDSTAPSAASASSSVLGDSTSYEDSSMGAPSDMDQLGSSIPQPPFTGLSSDESSSANRIYVPNSELRHLFSLDVDVLNEYCFAFNLIDSDADGFLSVPQVDTALRALGHELSPDDVPHLIKIALRKDPNLPEHKVAHRKHNKVVRVNLLSFLHFLRTSIPSAAGESGHQEVPILDGQRLQHVFREWDVVGTGHLSRLEVRRLFLGVGEKLNDREIDTLIETCTGVRPTVVPDAATLIRVEHLRTLR